MFRITKKRSIVALSIVAVLAIAGGAFAYFTSSGSGTGNVTVGSASNFTVNPSTATGGPLYPGSGTMTIPFTVTNPGAGSQQLNAGAAVVASSGGNVTHNGTPVTGCLASWFTATVTQPTGLPTVLAGGATSGSGSVAVTMTNAAASQNACQGVVPDITISAS